MGQGEKMIRVAIIGASGYTGAESIRIILQHSQADVVYLSALPEECGAVGEVFPQFKGRCNLQIEPLDFGKLSGLADCSLLSAPQGLYAVCAEAA
jgi:N-acetyl-gamma-glutamyl-phosphate reductase